MTTNQTTSELLEFNVAQYTNVIKVNVSLILLGTIFIVLRLWARHWYDSKAAFAADDLVAIFSYILTTILIGLQIGAYLWTPSPGDPDVVHGYAMMQKFYLVVSYH